MNLSEEKNKVIQSIQDIFQEYIRVQEDMINQEFHHGRDMKGSLETIRNQEIIIATHLETIQNQEAQISEYKAMIRNSEDKIKTHSNEAVIRLQADEIANKDIEIERLNKVIFKAKKKDQTPPKGKSTVIDTILTTIGETIEKLEPEFEEESPETETIVSRNIKYLIIKNDGKNIVYSILENDGIGPKVGVWSLTKTGKRKVIIDK